jgi:hypothetical protein
VTWGSREIKKEKGGSAGVWPVLSDGEQEQEHEQDDLHAAMLSGR